MGSLARRMSEPGRYQVIEENVVINRANLIQSLNAKLFEKAQQPSPSPPPTLPKPSQQASQECSQQHEAFLQSLNAKLAQQVQKQSTQQPPPSQKNASPPVLSQKQNFKESLNAKLAQQHSAAETGGGSQRNMARRASAGDAATRLRQWMGSRAPADPVSCRESLMDQIRRGASLRKTFTDDRSAPRIQWLKVGYLISKYEKLEKDQKAAAAEFLWNILSYLQAEAQSMINKPGVSLRKYLCGSYQLIVFPQYSSTLFFHCK